MGLAKSPRLPHVEILFADLRHRSSPFPWRARVPLHWQEVAIPLLIILCLITLKYVPAFEGLPLAHAAGVVAFGSASVLALRLIQSEEAVVVDSWAELRPSLVEHFVCLASAGLGIVLLSAVVMIGANKATNPLHMGLTFSLGVSLMALAFRFGAFSHFTRVRWNSTALHLRNYAGKETKIHWSDVLAVDANWRGVVLLTSSHGRLRFSQFSSGAAQLHRDAANRARRNVDPARRAFATR
jgi:hypothetical protein